MDKTLEALTRAYQEVTEGRFVIPEEVPATERTAFHGAAAAAHKSGKSHFTFGGKKYPVTMKKDTAKAIADDVKEDVENEMMQKNDVVHKAVKKKGKDDPTPVKGETATMNPKIENKKETAESVKSADKKPEKYVGPDGKTKIRMVPVDKEVVKKESTDMSIRDKLLSVIERKDHGNTDQKQPHDDLDSPNAKKMRDDHKDKGEYLDLEKQSHDDASKAGRVTKASAPNPTDKGAPGDKNVINPVKDTTKVGKGDPSVKESFSQQVQSIASAYQSMYEMDEGACVREMKKLYASNCSKNEMYTKCNEKYGCSKEKFESLYAQYCK